MGDILLQNGDLPKQPQIVNDHRITIQRIGAALATFEGEWIPDETVGLPWLEWFQTTPRPVDQIQGAVRREIAAVDGVGEVTRLDTEFDRQTGVMRFEVDLVEDTLDQEVAVEFTMRPDPHESHPIFTIQQVI